VDGRLTEHRKGCSVKRIAWFCIAAQLIVPTVLPQVTSSARVKEEAPDQRFVCNTGYTAEECRQDLAVLRKALENYPVAQLGNWTWILVRSGDWKPIQLARGLHADSPAFTYYEKRETFIEEALVREVPVRHRELLLKWNMSMRNLLDLAIGHELGHALCNDKDESSANRVGAQLRAGNSLSCRVELQAKVQEGKAGKPR
jgi:hypothetical protein